MKYRVGCAIGMACWVACSPSPYKTNAGTTPVSSSYGSELLQESLLDHVPAEAAFALVLRRNSLGWLRDMLGGDPATKAALSKHFASQLGVDLTDVTGLVLVGF